MAYAAANQDLSDTQKLQSIGSQYKGSTFQLAGCPPLLSSIEAISMPFKSSTMAEV